MFFQKKYIDNIEINMLRCEKLYWAIATILNQAVYIKNSIGNGDTYCNIATYDLFDSRCTAIWNVLVQEGMTKKIKFPMGQTIKAYDYDLSPILPNRNINNILNAPIPIVFEACQIAQKKDEIRLLTQKEAQEKANKGIPCMIISKEYNHVAISCPHLLWSEDYGKMILLPYDEKKGCFTGNVGENNDIMYLEDKRGFGNFNWKDEEKILYVQFKKTEGIYDD